MNLIWLLFKHSLTKPLYTSSADGRKLIITGTGAVEASATSKFAENVVEVRIGNDIDIVGDYSFSGFLKLESVIFDKKSILNEIGAYAFFNAAKLSVSLPPSVTKLGAFCFGRSVQSSNRNHRAFINLNNGLREIGDHCFSYSRMRSISIPKTVISIGVGAFQGSVIGAFKFEDNILIDYLNDSMFKNFTTFSHFEIPSRVRRLGNKCFYESKIYTSDRNHYNGNTYFDEPIVHTSDRDHYSGDIHFGGHYEHNSHGMIFVNTSKYLSVIGDYCFSYSKLRSITIPKTVISIGVGAFQGSVVGAFEFEDNILIDYLNDSMFRNFTTLSHFEIPSCVTRLGYKCFYESKIHTSNRNHYNGNIHFDGYYRHNGHNMVFINLSKYLNVIGDYCFSYSIIELITIPKTVTSIGIGAFQGSVIDTFKFEDNILIDYLNYSMFRNFTTRNNLEIPSYISRLGDRCFYGLKILEPNINNFRNSNKGCLSLMIGLQEIEDYCFSYSRIRSITIPKTVTSIGVGAFQGSVIGTFKFEDNILIDYLNDSMFKNFTTFSHFEIPSYTTGIGSRCFYELKILASNAYHYFSSTHFNGRHIHSNHDVASISLSRYLRYIGSHCFSYSRMRSITIPKTVTIIGVGAFQGSVIDTFKFEDNILIDYLNDSVFRNFTTFSHFEIPSRVRRLGNKCFYESKIHTSDRNNYNGDIHFDGYYRHNGHNMVFINLSKYLNVIGDYCFSYSIIELITIPKTVISIGVGAFQGSVVGAFKFEDNILINYLNDSMFRNFTTLSHFEIPSCVTRLGNKCFYESTIYTSNRNHYDGDIHFGGHSEHNIHDMIFINLPKYLSVIGNYCFSYSRLRSITIPKTVVSIGVGAFQWSAIDTFKFEDNIMIDYLNDSMFECFVTSNSLVLPDSVSCIKKRCFLGAMIQIKPGFPFTLSRSLKEIGDFCFSFTVVEFIFIPDTVVSIGIGAFKGSNISSLIFGRGIPIVCFNRSLFELFHTNSPITIPAQVTRLEERCFAGATLLLSINFNQRLLEVGDFCFSRSKIRSLTIPNSVKSIGVCAFKESKIDRLQFGVNMSIRYFNDSLFEGITTTESLSIPSSVERLGSRCFSGASVMFGHMKLFIHINSRLKEIGFSCFSQIRANSITIPNSIRSIGVEAFKDSIIDTFKFEDGVSLEYLNISLFERFRTNKTLTIPRAIKKICDNAFRNSDIARIEFEPGSSLQEIGDAAFMDSILTSIVLPNTVVRIGRYCFKSSVVESQLEFIVLSEGIKHIGSQCFYKTTKLKSVTYFGTIVFKDYKDSNVFYGTSAKEVYVTSMYKSKKFFDLPVSVVYNIPRFYKEKVDSSSFTDPSNMKAEKNL